ncbi:unnamed protein product [Paramecium octaurelia]|uniref:Uncharacterized protein n=1 Tax=Paramecium octaurelia TaxID=43137 RepID=A0A8S1XPC4_PAROT|nr:unnamed protein product [Paramecium octaurelia]
MLFKIVRNALITFQKSTPKFYFNQTIEPKQQQSQQDEMYSTVLATEQYKYKFNYICG